MAEQTYIKPKENANLAERILLWPNYNLEEGIIYEECSKNIGTTRGFRLIGRSFCVALGGLVGALVARTIYDGFDSDIFQRAAMSTDYALNCAIPLTLAGEALGFYFTGICSAFKKIVGIENN